MMSVFEAAVAPQGLKLTVLNVAYPFAPVGDKAVGGAEHILGDLDRALLGQGHRSLVMACEGSNAAGVLYSSPTPEGLLDGSDRTWFRSRSQAVLDRVLRTEQVDLIHMHGQDFHEYTLPRHIPVLVTLHMPICWYPKNVWSLCGQNVWFQCVSRSQRAACPPELRDAMLITNGVSLPQVREKKRDFAMALGRICPEKNVHEALEAGTKAGVPVLLGGEVFPSRTHMEYYHHRVEPLLQCAQTAVDHRFLGPLGPGKKERLLGQAKCLLHPTLTPESSSLVAMEALAGGTPVIAYRSGALPEIVEDGVTGFLVNNVEEMAGAIQRLDEIRPENCRAAAEKRFSKERMVREYMGVYRSLAAGGRSQRASA